MLKIVELFGSALLVDAGRLGYRKYGVPVGGAFDQECFHCANQLLENQINDAALEFALGSISFEVLNDTSIAVVGAADSLLINSEKSHCQIRTRLSKGDTVKINPPTFGIRTYVALPGGIECEKILESVSGIGLRKGGTITPRSSVNLTNISLADRPSSLKKAPFDIQLLCDETDWVHSKFIASHNMDRIGIRLEGKSGIAVATSTRSEPSAFGVVQVTESGELIIHGPDGPTITGYRKIASIALKDLNRVGQIAPGDEIQFNVN